jgi:DNA-binding LacI/PurR family transcriptional regulator
VSDSAPDKLAWTPLYEQLRQHLIEHIARTGLWGKQLGSEQDLAKHFGVSRGTVRKALDLLKREGILLSRQGRRTVVRPREPARGTIDHVAVVGFDTWQSPNYYAQIIAGITGASEEFQVALSSVVLGRPGGVPRFLGQLEEDVFAGIILVGMTERDVVEQILARSRCPAVLVDHYFDDLPLSGVIDDGEGGIRQAVLHLARLGHSRIAYIDSSRPEMNPWKRKGYLVGLREANLPLDRELIVRTHDRGGKPAEEVAGLFDLPEPATALVTCDPRRGFQVVQAAELRDLKIGRDVALAVYGTLYERGEPRQQLTTVDFDVASLGREGLRHLRAMMFGEEQTGRLIRVPAKLTVRSSSCPAAGSRVPRDLSPA